MPARASHPRVLKTAKIKITTKCNRSCDFCIFADGAQGENMSLDLFSTILARLETIPFQQLHINGGEPTVHRDFPALSDAARTRLPDKVMVLGTNAITLARNQRIMEATLRSYDQILIGCDDEHENYAEVHAVVPRLREGRQDRCHQQRSGRHQFLPAGGAREPVRRVRRDPRHQPRAPRRRRPAVERTARHLRPLPRPAPDDRDGRVLLPLLQRHGEGRQRVQHLGPGLRGQGVRPASPPLPVLPALPRVRRLRRRPLPARIPTA